METNIKAATNQVLAAFQKWTYYSCFSNEKTMGEKERKGKKKKKKVSWSFRWLNNVAMITHQINGRIGIQNMLSELFCSMTQKPRNFPQCFPASFFFNGAWTFMLLLFIHAVLYPSQNAKFF